MLALQSKVLAALALFAALGFAYFWVGHRAVEHYKTEQAMLQAKADKIQQDKYNAIAQELEVAKANRETVFRTITKTVEKVVEKPVYSTQCVEQEGVDVANAALEGKLP